jgi:ArsR family transcriptional regulator, arsenate/arsenite/antimonite-responsive transcriptional repressor
MDKLTLVFKALSDGNRLRIVAALVEHEELCACQLTELIEVTGATASRHMGVLLSSGLVESRKDGRWVYYRIGREDAGLEELIAWLEQQFEKDPDLARDSERLLAITACDPADICRKQRGEKCCPAT